MRRIETYKEIGKFFSFMITGGQTGAIFLSGFGIGSCILAKVILKCIKNNDENEKANKIINTWLKFNIVYFLTSLLSGFILKTNEEYNVIVFISITIVSIIMYILIKKIWNKIIKRRNNNGTI